MFQLAGSPINNEKNLRPRILQTKGIYALDERQRMKLDTREQYQKKKTELGIRHKEAIHQSPKGRWKEKENEFGTN